MSVNKIYTLLFALCVISCVKEPEVITNKSEDSNCINFSVGISKKAGAKVSTGNDFKTTFDDNDVVGLFIYIRNEGDEPSIDENELYAGNVKLTYKGGNWELERPIYYPDSKKILDIYAYYPYKEGADVHSLEYNANEEMVELLMASAVGTKKSEDAVMLKFKHMQSLIHITLVKDYNVPDFDENLKVYFNGIIGGKYNIATQELIEPLVGIMQMDCLTGLTYDVVRSYMAYIPEQVTAPGILFSIFQMTQGHEILSSKKNEQPEIFTRGEVKIFNIQIRQEISKDIVYNQFDLYPAYGTPVGMVVEVFGGGRHGKVISLKNIEGVQWGPMGISTGATDINDGITNKMKIQSLDNWENDYPAFKACNDYGERWYLPSIGDLNWFMTNNSAWNANFLSRINSNLERHRNNNSELSIELININQSYFSSTEADSNNAIKLHPSSRANIAEPKDWSYFVRPFYEF